MNIPAKPNDVTWTDDQWKAIHASGQDILVAAAAGSGKTAVLVERIIQKIINEENNVQVDEMLVATFTNASAAEMRQRIGTALEKEISKNPTSHHLRKQLNLLNHAAISTLHSFCLNVVRKYYYLIDIDPGFRIGDNTEILLMRDEAIENLLEEEYGKENNEDFFQVVDMFTNDRSDANLQNLIMKLYEFSRANADPEKWLNDCINIYDIDEEQTVDELPFIEPLLYEIELQLAEAKRLFDMALQLTKEPGGPYPRVENFLNDIQLVDRLQKAKEVSFQSLYEQFQLIKFTTLKRCTGDEFIRDLVEESANLRNKGKKIIQDLKEDLFSRKPESYLRDLREMKKPVQTLIKLVRAFSNKLTELKKEKGLVDFSDLEHFALQILGKKDPETGEILPTEAALDYQKQFKEVFIDEYQDTNMVQETILQLVKQPSEENGNLFMVGDVKQSIYRFRLAEPNLFLNKYLRFNKEGIDSGLRIDLAQNFRSRKEVLDGTNYIFKQIMGVKVGEIEYDETAELKAGAPYPVEDDYPIELTILHKDEKDSESPSTDFTSSEEGEEQEDGNFFSKEELEQSQMESRYIANQIRHCIDSKQQVFDPKTKQYRSIQYRDIVILLRSFTWAPQFLEELKAYGIPAYADISSGYFDATEIATMVALLKVVDNPYQDIPLAATLRSPLYGLDEEEMSKVRLASKSGSYYEALKQFLIKPALDESEEQLKSSLMKFHNQLNEWRTLSRQGALSDLIWQIYRDTKFYDYVGGLPGGKQRQANLRALYDRARQYESTSFRGLFRFLRFIERMQDRGDDLGVARALGEQEDVVRIITIHSSKGLEFPVVFVAGLGRKFNLMDIRKPFLFDKDFGLATNYINSEKQITYPSLFHMAIVRKKRLELVAEEMRVLYVALTRAKEKLYLVGSTKDKDQLLNKWQKHLTNTDWLLADYDRMKSVSYLDWVGPSLIRHRDSNELRVDGNEYSEEKISMGGSSIQEAIWTHPSKWKIQLIPEQVMVEQSYCLENENENYLSYVKKGELVPVHSEYKEQIKEQLFWEYPHLSATTQRSKQSVSEIKRLKEVRDAESGEELIRTFKKPIITRPKFMQEKKLTPAEIGTAMHMVMQHINLREAVTRESLQKELFLMQEKELLTEEEVAVIRIDEISDFFETPVAKRLSRAKWVKRELPFSLALSPKEIYNDWDGGEEPVFIQGIIDVLFKDEQGLVLLDYKTDQIAHLFKNGLEEAGSILKKRYETQIHYYKYAIESILKQPVSECYLFFFDGGHLIEMGK